MGALLFGLFTSLVDIRPLCRGHTHFFYWFSCRQMIFSHDDDKRGPLWIWPTVKLATA